MRLLAFYIGFTLHISIQAANLIQDPKDCLELGVWCALSNSTRLAQTLEFETYTADLAAQSSLVHLSDKHVRILSGRIHFKATADIKVEAYNFTGVVPRGGEVFIRVDSDRVHIKSLKASFQYQPSGLDALELPEGFQVWIGDMTTNGNSQLGFPQAIHIRSHLKDWSKTFRHGRELFRVAAKKWVREQKAAIQLSSDLQKEFVQKALADLREQRRLEEMKRRRRAAEDARLRQIFRQRNGWE